MKITQSYGIKFKGGYKAVKRTIVIFNDAVNYLITPVQDHYDAIVKLGNSKMKMTSVPVPSE